MTEARPGRDEAIVTFEVMAVLRSVLMLALGFGLISVGALIFMALSLVLLPWRATRVRMANLYGKICGRAVFWIAGIKTDKVNFEGLGGQFPAVYVSNHTSTMDGPLAMWVCPMGGAGVSKKELARIPFFGWLYLLSGHLLIDRGNREKAVASMRELSAVVKKNDLGIWIWPEGTRSRDGRLLAFKKGFVHLAIATGLPVVPVVVSGAQHIWNKGSFIITPSRIRIEVLDAIDTSSWSVDTVDEHVDHVRQIFIDHLPADQHPLEEAPAIPLKQAANA